MKNIQPRIYLALPTELAYCRAMVRGVRQYLRLAGGPPLGTADLNTMTVEDWSTWRMAGVIGMLSNPRHAQLASLSGAPIVNVSTATTIPGIPLVRPDNQAIGRMACRYFLDRGLRSLAYVGIPDHNYANERLEGFQAEARAAGVEAHVYDGKSSIDKHLSFTVEAAKWASRLPRPLGLLCANDQRAQRFMEGCAQIDLNVPADVAVLGVDNDDVIGELAPIPISSVDPQSERIGYEAAALLDRLMHGEPAPKTPITVPPIGVVTRESTDVIASADPDVATAMRIIRQRAAEPIQVGDLLNHVSVSRRTLEKRFFEAFGLTLHDQIKRVQFEKARKLLTDTELPIPHVARQAGFSDPKRFATQFRLIEGVPPTAYRRQFRRTLQPAM